MPDSTELGRLPVEALRGLYLRGEVSPVAVIDAALAAIERVEPSLNAVVYRMDDAAREQARESERRLRDGSARPLEGVPLPIKDNVAVAGAPMTLASSMAPDFDMPVDHSLVARLRAAGAVFVCKTNLPEFGTIPSTENRRFGATHNPWDLERTPGGSSGGSAALVAAGVTAAAHGNDGGGSLRIPAACCNLFTLKPTRGMVSKAPFDDDGMGLSIDGFMSHTVRDNALLLDVIAGSEIGDWQTWTHRPGSLRAAVDGELPRLRVGLVTSAPLPGAEVHPAHAEATRALGRLLEGMGHTVEEAQVDWEGDGLQGLFMQFWANLIAQGIELLAAFGGDPAGVEPHNAALHAIASAMSAPQFTVVHASIRGWARRIQERTAGWDVVLTPTLLQPPGRLGAIFDGADVDPMAPMVNALAYAAFTAAMNVTGQPAVSLPVAMHDGLPVGVMAAGRAGADGLLYRLSADVEEAMPWAGRRPPLSV